MTEKEQYTNSFSNAAYEVDAHNIKFEDKNAQHRRNTFIFALIVILLVSIGVGIGIGYAIGANKVDDGGGNYEPIVDSEVPPTEGSPTTEKRATTPHSLTETTEKEHTDSPTSPLHSSPASNSPTTPLHSSPASNSPTPPRPTDWIDMPCRDNTPKCPAGISSPPVLLISLDGFRSDFPSRGLTPVISRMAECGVSTPYLIPTFPTVTFPNHYTIVTGLYPESHGIVGNTIYDFGTKFSLGSSESLNKRWWGGEPIWNTARWQGKRSGTFFWPGSDSDIQGIRPNYYNKYDGDLNYIQRVDTVLGWLRLPDGYRPDVVTLYFDEPDHTGHDPGPNSDEENEIIQRMDGMMRRLMDGLLAMDMLDCVNIITISDHGMANRTCDQKFILNDYLSSSDYRIVTTAGTMLRMEPNDDATVSDPEQIVDDLLCQHDVAIPYLKNDLPKRWHYAFNDRIEPVEVPVPEQWTASGGSTSYCNGGTHGYDNLGNLMKAMFVANGPGFKSRIDVKPFQNIELYNLMCELIDLEPSPNNGTLGSLHHIMRSPKPLPDTHPTPPPEMECHFPASDADYNDRLANDISGCNCSTPDIGMYDKQLNLSTTQVGQAMMTHAPLGTPVVTFDTDYCTLTQTDYVTGYSHDLRTPLWTSFTLHRPQPVGQMPPLDNCRVRPDVRIEAEYSSSCSDYESLSGNFENLDNGYLFPPSLTDSLEREMDALISSNIVPQYTGFMQDVWDGFLTPHLALWANISSEINVVTGPVFDFNGNGHRDNNDTLEKDGVIFGDSPTLLPTHYFMVVTRCKGGAQLDAACAEIESAAFVLRNSDGIKTCQTQADYMEHNLASIQDIEKLTGLMFFSDLPVYDAIQLKLHAPAKGELWSNWPLI